MPRATEALPTVANRLRAVLLHVPHYSIESIARLAADTGCSKSALSRLVRQLSGPTYRSAETIAWAISKQSGVKLSPRDLFTRDGTYPNPSACKLMGCKGCYPPEAWDEGTDRLRPEWRHQKPGEWSCLQAIPSPPGTTI